MSPWLWVLVLVAAVWAAHWGAEHVAAPLKKLRRQWGISAAAGGALIGIASASPEIGINTTSALRGVSGIGLGASLGVNILAIPLVITIAYWASRTERLGAGEGGSAEADESGESRSAHHRHLEEGLLRIRREAVTVHALPYLAILGVLAVLTLPARWRGLQPVDGWILLGAYAAYLAQALLRGRETGEDVKWTRKEIGLAVGGVAVLAFGTYLTVMATEHLVSAIGIPDIVGGLFITAPMAAMPETFAAWSVTRSGQVTTATTAVVSDKVVTLSLALLPLALISAPITDFRLFWVSLAFVFLVPVAYAAFVHWGSEEHGFTLWQVVAFDAVYVAYVAVLLVGGIV
jgi:cation:H+ antiporter